MKNLFVRFVKNESGATAIEYGLIAAGISVAIIAVVNGLGTQLNTTFSTISAPASPPTINRRPRQCIKGPGLACRGLSVWTHAPRGALPRPTAP